MLHCELVQVHRDTACLPQHESSRTEHTKPQLKPRSMSSEPVRFHLPFPLQFNLRASWEVRPLLRIPKAVQRSDGSSSSVSGRAIRVQLASFLRPSPARPIPAAVAALRRAREHHHLERRSVSDCITHLAPFLRSCVSRPLSSESCCPVYLHLHLLLCCCCCCCRIWLRLRLLHPGDTDAPRRPRWLFTQIRLRIRISVGLPPPHSYIAQQPAAAAAREVNGFASLNGWHHRGVLGLSDM